MKNLMRKELLLAMHPASVLFLLLSAMLLIPNYPYYVICFYTCLGTFFHLPDGAGEPGHRVHGAAARAQDRSRAGARFTVMLMQLAQLVIAVPFAVFSSRVSAENLVGMDANTAFFRIRAGAVRRVQSCLFPKLLPRAGQGRQGLRLGLRRPYFCMVVFEACAHTVPFVWDRLDTPDPAFLGEKAHLIGRWRHTVRAAVGAGIAARHAKALPRWTCEPASRFAV